MNKYAISWRGFRSSGSPIDVTDALDIYRTYDRREATLVLAFPGVELKGKPEELALVVRSKLVQPYTIYATDECVVDEWEG